MESLTSYISRLAEAHSVTVGALINEVIGPKLNLMYLLRSSRYGGSRFYDLGYELNGLGKLAEQAAGVVSQLCGFYFAKELALLKWRDVFPPRELLRQHKAWCPLCLAEWKESKDNVVYEPLLWSIKLVDVCTKHGLQLETKCPSCKKIIPILSRQLRNGYCSYCGTWLGNMSLDQGISVLQAAMPLVVGSVFGVLYFIALMTLQKNIARPVINSLPPSPESSSN